MLNQILKEAAADAERDSWKVADSASFLISIVIDGYGFSREIKELADDDGYSGITRKQAMAMVSKAKRKGFEASCRYIQHKRERIA